MTLQTVPPPIIRKDVETLPPWERAEMRIDEVPQYLKRLYNMQVAASTVYRWTKTGLVHRDQRELDIPLESKARILLATEKRAGRTYVRAVDLRAFLENT